MKRKLAAAAMVLGCTVIACQLVAGIERVDKTDPAVVDAGPDALAADSAVADPCAHVRPAPKPLVDDAPNDKLPDIYLALHHVDLAPSATNTAAPGFDLDQSCTCDTRPGTAFEGGASCTTGAKPFCDFDGGVDNQIFNFARDYAAFIDVDQAANINGSIASGHQTVILVIKEYNGRANDSAVSFGTFSSEGMREGPTCPGSTTDTDGFSSPGWCGEDKWTASSSSVDGTSGLFVPKSIGTGYVTNYQFVVELNNPATVPFARLPPHAGLADLDRPPGPARCHADAHRHLGRPGARPHQVLARREGGHQRKDPGRRPARRGRDHRDVDRRLRRHEASALHDPAVLAGEGRPLRADRHQPEQGARLHPQRQVRCDLGGHRNDRRLGPGPDRRAGRGHDERVLSEPRRRRSHGRSGRRDLPVPVRPSKELAKNSCCPRLCPMLIGLGRVTVRLARDERPVNRVLVRVYPHVITR